MYEPPSFLPGANSTKWHNRRWWDTLGYIRVRTLANPRWQRDVPWLRRILETDAEHEQVPEVRAALRRAAGAAARHPRTSGGHTDDETAWRELLAVIDEALLERQNHHLHEVHAGGTSAS